MPSEISLEDLFDAASTNNLELAQTLLAQGHLVDEGRIGYTPLYRAIASRHEDSISMLRLLLQAGADVNAPQGADGSKDIMLLAVGHKLFKVTELLLEHGAAINAPPGTTGPLHVAAAGGNPKMIEFLLLRGADTTLRDEEGKTPREVYEDTLIELAEHLPNWEPPTPEVQRRVRELLSF